MGIPLGISRFTSTDQNQMRVGTKHWVQRDDPGEQLGASGCGENARCGTHRVPD